MKTFFSSHPDFTLEIYQTDDLQQWIEIYLHACRSRNLSGGTIEFYDKKLKVFVQFCREHEITKISQIMPDHLRQFMIALEQGGHRPAGTHCYYRSVKSFLKWYEREAEPTDWRNPINKVKAPHDSTRATGPGADRNRQSHAGNLQARQPERYP